MFSYVSIETRVPQDHPLRAMRTLVDACLQEMSPRFALLYARTGRPSIPPEKLLRAQLLQVLYTIRSERLLMEQLDYNLLFRWFVGLTMDDPVWDATVFTKNRERLLAGDVARGLLEQVLAEAQARQLLSSEHFSVDGTLIERGRVSRVSSARTRRAARLRTIRGIRPSTSMASGAATPPTPRRPTRTRDSRGKGRARRRSSTTKGTS
jgi:transposase